MIRREETDTSAEEHGDAKTRRASLWRAHWRKVLTVLAIFAVGFAIVAVYFAERPWYRGRPIGFWFDGLNQQYRTLRSPTGSSSWGSPSTWVNLENPQILKEFEPFRRMGAEAVPFLLNVLEHPRPELDTRKTLRKLLPQKFKWLAPFPKPPSEQQLLALWVLGEIGPSARGATSNVLRFVEIPGLDYVALNALSKIGVDADAVMPVLCRSLVQQSASDTESAAKSGRLGHGRPAVLQLLSSLGPSAQSATPILVEEQERCIERIRALDEYATSHDWSARFVRVEKVNLLYTVEALCRISLRDGHKAVPFLAKILRDREFFTEHARLGLAEMKSSPVQRWAHPSGRARAAKCLNEIGSAEAVLVLKDFLKDDDADVSAAAREAVERAAKK